MILWKITKFLMSYCEKRGKVFKITGTAGPDDVYLIRYYVIKSKYFNFFIHQFLRSDRDDLHDHPWDFCTYLVRGNYTEEKFNPKTWGLEKTVRINHAWVKKNLFVYRKATDQHRVVVSKDRKEFEKDEAATTLFFSGPTKREWGFVRQRTELGGLRSRTWVNWKEYLNLPPDTKSRG